MEFSDLKTFNTEPEAQIFRIFLEENGVPAFIFDSNSSTIYPVFNSTIGGYKLRVRTEDWERARALQEEFYLSDDNH